MSVLALDIGGTKLAAARADDTGSLAGTTVVPTPRGLDAEGLWTAVRELAARVLAGVRPDAVGVGCGGPMRWPAGEVSPLNIPAWRDFPLRDRLAAEFPGVPVRVHNDAVCVAAGEHWRGTGRGRDHLLGMVVSTGVGGGLLLGGRIVDGATGNAGHIGHVVVDPDGPPCDCGGRGCLEAVARGPALAAWAVGEGWAGGDARALAADAARGDPVAGAALRRAGTALGVALASAVHLLDLEVVCIGGGLVQAGRLLLDPARAAYRAHARLPYAREVPIVSTGLGQDAGLVGAAAIALDGSGRYWSAG